MTLRDTELYDEDTDTYYSDDSCYCRHGTYIGTPGGPDLMCGACEMGEPSFEEIDDETHLERIGIIFEKAIDRFQRSLKFFLTLYFAGGEINKVTDMGRYMDSDAMNDLYRYLSYRRSFYRIKEDREV